MLAYERGNVSVHPFVTERQERWRGERGIDKNKDVYRMQLGSVFPRKQGKAV